MLTPQIRAERQQCPRTMEQSDEDHSRKSQYGSIVGSGAATLVAFRTRHRARCKRKRETAQRSSNKRKVALPGFCTKRQVITEATSRSRFVYVYLLLNYSSLISIGKYSL